MLDTRAWRNVLGLADATTPDLFVSIAEVDQASPYQQAHLMRSAIERLTLEAILCTEGKPIAYVKALPNEDPAPIRQLHRLAWSQGVAPLLIVVSPEAVRILSCFTLPAAEADDIFAQGRLVQALSPLIQATEIHDVVRSLQYGTYFDGLHGTQNAGRSFNPRHRVDRYLLANLEALRQEVEAVNPLFTRSDVHRLLGRLIFTCYLIDRGILVPADLDELGAHGCTSVSDLLQLPNGIDLLFALFTRLQREFNGDMFAGNLQAERARFRPEHSLLLSRFLRGDNIVTGQQSLGFWAYDFSVIPIETISAIYESFLQADDFKQKKQDGAFYTPRFLCEIVLDQALAGVKRLQGRRYLDPACGSGIFLVGLFNRMAEEWRRENPNTDNTLKYQSLVAMLKESLFGIDISETACRISALSLYLALLDQLEPKEIRLLPERALPQLLHQKDANVASNLLVANFFAELPKRFYGFDSVIGNPPWVRVDDPEMASWITSSGHAHSQKQAALAFAWKALRHVEKQGSICLLLPTSFVLNHSDLALRAQRDWLSAVTLDSALNLADIRHVAFENATRPAIAIRFHSGAPDHKDYFTYSVPKADLAILRAEVLSISTTDRSQIRQGALIHALKSGRLPAEWRRYSWASGRDREFLERLDEYPTVGEVAKEREWIVGSGMQPLTASGLRLNVSQMGDFQPSDLFLGRLRFPLVASPSDCESLGGRALKPWHRIRREKPEIFQPPHVLVGMKLQAMFADFPVYFQDALRGIHGPKEDREALMLLSAVLGSELIRYYYFHTSSSWGNERDKVQLDELLRCPFFLQAETPEAREAKEEITKRMAELIDKTQLESFGSLEVRQSAYIELQPLINELFEVGEHEQILVDDTLKLWLPSATPNRNTEIRASRPALADQRNAYLTLLEHTLNKWRVAKDRWFQTSAIVSESLSLGVVVVSITSGDQRLVQREQASQPDLDRILQVILREHQKLSKVIRPVTELRVFLDSNLYVVKPLTKRYWASSIALDDASRIAGEIILMRGRE